MTFQNLNVFCPVKYTVHLLKYVFKKICSPIICTCNCFCPLFSFFLRRHELFDSISFLHYGLLFLQKMHVSQNFPFYAKVNVICAWQKKLCPHDVQCTLVCSKLFFCKQLSLMVNNQGQRTMKTTIKIFLAFSVVLDLKVKK